MKPREKEVVYQTRNSYATLNSLSDSTHYVWLVFHGIGYLSRYFLRYFTDFPTAEHYFIAPQAPSKYYLNGEYKHVGASWLTRENTGVEKDNVMAYLDAVWEAEAIPESCKLIVLGYSQGVSIAARYLAYKKLVPEHLILFAGGLPEELAPGTFGFLGAHTRTTFVYGEEDPYLNPERMVREKDKLEQLFDGKSVLYPFAGGHVFKKELLPKLLA